MNTWVVKLLDKVGEIRLSIGATIFLSFFVLMTLVIAIQYCFCSKKDIYIEEEDDELNEKQKRELKKLEWSINNKRTK